MRAALVKVPNMTSYGLQLNWYGLSPMAVGVWAMDASADGMSLFCVVPVRHVSCVQLPYWNSG